MTWHHIPDYDNSTASMDDNPFASSRVKTTGKVSVTLPVDEWLCKKLEKLNVTIAEGYPRNSETSGLLRDQFVKTPRSSKWYDMQAVKKGDGSTQAVSHWSPEPAKLNSMFSRVARRSLPSAPASRTFSQDTLRRWEKAFREQSVMCNHAADLSRCLTKVQDSMVTQLKSLRSDSSKGKSAERTQQAVEELEYLVTLTGQFPKLCSAPCRISQREFSSAWPTSVWHVTIAIWSLYVVESNLIPYLHCVLLQYIYSHYSPTAYWSRQKMRFHVVRRGVLWVTHRGNPDVFIRTFPPVLDLHTSRTGNPLHRLGNKSETGKLVRKVEVKPQTSTKSRPKGLRSINDNYCVSNVVGVKDSVIVSDQMEGLNPPPVPDQKNSKVTLNVDSHVANAHIVTGLPQRKGVNPNACQLYTEIKYVKDVSCVGHLPSVNLVTNAQHAVLDPPVGARLNQCWEKWETLGSSPKVVNILREGYTLPFRFRPHLTRSPTVISNYHNPTKQSFLLEALYQLINKSTVEPVDNPNSLGFYNRLFLVPKPNNRWRPILDLSTLNTFLNTGSFKMENPETIRTSLQVGEWVTSIDFKDAYFHIPIHSQSRKYMRFHLQGRSYQFKALPFGLSTAPMEFTVVAKEVKLMALQKGIRIHQYLDDWLVRASTHHTCLQHTQTLITLCQELGWLVNKEKSELVPKQVFNFVGYQFNLKEGKVRPTEERWQALTDKIRSIMSDPVCPVRKFMSLIGLLTATEKQVHLGRLHMRPIQWHLKNNWRVPESLEKVIPVPKSLHPHLRWWLEESNVLLGQPLHPLKHALQIFTDASNEGWGAHLDDHTARGTWSLPESKLHINHLELKVVFLALKEFRTLVCNKTVLIATDNTTVVAYINKEGGMKSGSLCALLWRILSWCTRQQVTFRARHIPGRLNVIADKLSRLGQTIQTEWSLHPAVFQAVCSRWHQPQVDLFATRFNNKLPQFVSPVPDPQAWAVDALSLSWEDLDPYAFPLAAILGKVVEKLQDYPCNRIILIAPGWPNMPWFWDLVAMSSQIPLCLPSIPNLVSQPFNQVLHRNLSNLNLHAWLLEPQQSRSKASLRQWQHKLRLLKEDQPDLSMRQSGPFLQSGASVIRWTSGHYL